MALHVYKSTHHLTCNTAVVSYETLTCTPGSGRPTLPGRRSPLYGLDRIMLVSVMP